MTRIPLVLALCMVRFLNLRPARIGQATKKPPGWEAFSSSVQLNPDAPNRQSLPKNQELGQNNKNQGD
jgi:hypothetical protein